MPAPLSAVARRSGRATDPAMFTFEPHYGQWLAWQAFHELHYRIVVMVAGTGSGKTFSAARILYPFFERGGLARTHLWTEPTYKMLVRVLLPTVLPFLDAYRMGIFRKGDMLYELAGGGRILFGSADIPNSLQGAHIDGTIWADEVGLYSEEAWEVLEQRAALYQAPMLATTTPYTLPWLERRLAKPAEDPQQRTYRLIQFPSFWNPAYPREEYERQKRMLPKDKFDRLYRGLFVRIGGIVFDSFDESRNVAVITPIEGTRRLHVKPGNAPEFETEIVSARAGMDWGWAPDPGCLLLGGKDALGRLFVWGEHYETHVQVERGTNEGADTWIARALAWHRQWGLDALYCDPSRPSDIQLMRDYGLPAVGAENNQEYGIDAVNQQMMPLGGGYGMGCYIASNRCPNLVRTIGTYVRQKRSDGDGYLPRPAPNQEDHGEDTLRYLIAGDRRKADVSAAGVPAAFLGAPPGGSESRRSTAVGGASAPHEELPPGLAAILPKAGLAARNRRGR